MALFAEGESTYIIFSEHEVAVIGLKLRLDILKAVFQTHTTEKPVFKCHRVHLLCDKALNHHSKDKAGEVETWKVK